MNESDIPNAATQAAQKAKTIVGRQVDLQATALGATLSQTARDLEAVGTNLRTSGTIGGAAQLADWAASYAERAGNYLANGDPDRFSSNAGRLPDGLLLGSQSIGRDNYYDRHNVIVRRA